MGILRFRISAKQSIEFSKVYTQFIRNSTTTNTISIPYTNASGQSLTFGQILYTYLTPGNNGYIQIKSNSNQILSGSGTLNVEMTHMVSSTQANQTITFNYDSSPISIDVSYNSKPVAQDIIKDLNNRSIYIFLNTDFTNAYSDFDSDSLSEVSITGDITGYELNGSAYVEGQWIPMSTVSSGNLRYVSLSQDTYYEKNNVWKAKDINGNISE